MMKRNFFRYVTAPWLLLCFLFQSTAQSQAPATPIKRTPVKLIYGALTAANTPIWVAADQHLYEKYGLELQVIHGRGATPVQALAGGTAEIGHFAAGPAIAASLSGSDLVFIGAQTNYVVLSIWTRKDSAINSLAELAGRPIAVGAPGSATHTMTRLALRKAGVVDKDIRFIHHGSIPDIFVSLDKGLVEAGVASAPRPGFEELVDLATQKIPFLQGGIIARRAFIQSQRPVVLSFLKAFVEAMKISRERPDVVVASLVKHLRVRPEVAQAAYRSFVNVWEEIPYARTESVQAALDLLPKETVRDALPQKFIDNSLIKELETSGFIKTLYRR